MTYNDKRDLKNNIMVMTWYKDVPVYASSFIKNKSKKTAGNTLRIYINNINIFWNWCSKNGYDNSLKSIDNITEHEVTLFINDIISRFATPTVLSIISTLSSLYSYLLSTGDVSENPFSKVERPRQIKEEPKYLSDEDKESLLRVVTKGENMPKRFLSQELTHGTRARNIAMTKLLLTTGIKASELVSLNISDINFNLHTLAIHIPKNKIKLIKLESDVELSIKECMYMRTALGVVSDEQALFTASQGRNKGKRISIQTVDGLIKKYAVAAGLPNADKMNPNKLKQSCEKGCITS